jgi:hypothetical protein
LMKPMMRRGVIAISAGLVRFQGHSSAVRIHKS